MGNTHPPYTRSTTLICLQSAIMNMLIVLSLLAIAVGYSHAAVNIALNKPARQISNHGSAYANKAVDGNAYWYFPSGYCTHTGDDQDPWWVVDLGKEYEITKVKVFNRRDAAWRLSNIVVGGLNYFPIQHQAVSRTSSSVCGEHVPAVPSKGTATITCGANFATRYLIIQLKK